MTIKLPDLPYAHGALAPHVSERTLEFHHGKHHATYVKTLNELVDGTDLAGRSLEDIVRASAGRDDRKKIFNNAAQVWNHDFYWRCMSPGGGGTPSGDLATRIDKDLGGFDAFAKSFKEAAVTQFGSGWAWLVHDGDKLRVTQTANADLPLAHGQVALLTIDVWEHAYYLDYQNRRADYVETFIDKLIDWDFVAQNMVSARKAA